jgi:hypothetical protein
MKLQFCVTQAVLLLAFSAAAQAESIWIEGEQAAVKQITAHPWYDSVKREVLSGGAWAGHFNRDKAGLLVYEFSAAADDTYRFWLRANHVKASLAYRLNGGPWQAIDLARDQRGAMNIASDNKPDLRFISWLKVGDVKLKRGSNKLEFRMDSEAQNHGAIDCFCLTTDAWVPSGTTRPGGGDTSREETAGPADAIWIEGESSTSHQMTRHGWYDSVKQDALSGGQWISNFNDQRAGTAQYTFRVLEADSFAFWVRANPLRAKLSYRLDEAEDWTPIDLERDQRGLMNIAADNKPDLRFITWVKAGDVRLKSGAHKIAFKMDSELHHHGGLDCFVFVRIPFVPSGARKPKVRGGPAGPDEWFPVIFDDDPLSPDSVIDVSHVVEAPAGKFGFLRRDGAGLRFERADRPVKLWGVGAAPGDKSPEQMVQAARWFRKHGINAVRQHTVLSASGLMDVDGKLSAEKLDRYDRWFAALKEQGIYTTWSVIYPHHGAFLQKSDGYDPELFAELDESDTDRDGRRGPIVVNDYINLDRRLQDIALRYFDKLLNHTNPHTGLKYKDDPALAVLEFQNESNVFFHTLNGLRSGKPSSFARAMRRMFFQFIQSKYKTREAVARAWNNRWDRHDDWEAKELGLMGAYHWGCDGPLHEFGGQLRRTGDYLEFLARLQRDYYARREKEVRSIGFKGVTVTTAWRSGGPAGSMANLYADTAADMIDRHNYFGGGDGRHRIVEGKVSNQTHLERPGTGLLGLALFQVEDRPFGVSEWSMMPPAPYKAEAGPLYAFYGMGLQGWDASHHFNCGSHRMGDGWPGLSKYVSQTPHYMGQFPALAFAVHNNHIQEGPIVAARRLGREAVFSGKDVLGQSLAGGGHDDKQLVGRLSTPPEAIAIGRVTIAFGAGEPSRIDLSRYWDKRSQSLTSTTGELVWRYGDRCVEVRSPKTQGVIGFTGGKRYELPAAVAEIKTPFVSLLLTPLDNEDLGSSRRILITAMARDKQTDAAYNADWSRLDQMGGPPLLMEPVQATMRLHGATPAQVRPLDVYGVPRPEKLAVRSDGSFTIDGTYRTYYYFVER